MSNAEEKRTLTVSVVEYYGRTTIKPECETSRIFAELLGQRTLTKKNIETIKRLGFRVEQKEKEL